METHTGGGDVVSLEGSRMLGESGSVDGSMVREHGLDIVVDHAMRWWEANEADVVSK